VRELHLVIPQPLHLQIPYRSFDSGENGQVRGALAMVRHKGIYLRKAAKICGI